MRIKITNNRNGKVENKLIEKMARYYLTEQIGADKVDGIRTLTITFKKLVSHRGGYAQQKFGDYENFKIVLNSRSSVRDIYRILAHECTHIKQYFTKELDYKLRCTSRRRQWIKVWRGKEYLRKAYNKRPWEIDARKGEKMAHNILNKLNGTAKPKVVRKPAEIKPVVLNKSTADIVIGILKEGSIPNGDLIPKVLNGNKDKQTRINTHKEIFALKRDGVIREVIKDSIVWVELV